MSVAEFRTVCHPGRARSKTATRNPCRRFLDAPEQIRHQSGLEAFVVDEQVIVLRHLRQLRLRHRSVPAENKQCRATVAIQYSHRCILQDVNVSDSYHPRIFQDIRNFSPFQNSPRSPERKQSLTQRGDVLRRISGRYCWETELKPQCLPRIVDESTNPQVVVMRKTAIFFFKWMDQIVMSMIFPNKTSYKPIV